MCQNLTTNLIPILFDTSTWDLVIRNSPTFRVDDLLKRGIVPLITLEIILELMNVSKELRKKRLNYLLSLPIISTINLDSKHIGSIVDLRCLEYKFILEKNYSKSIFEFIKDNITYLKGSEIDYFSRIDLDDFIKKQSKTNISISQSMWNNFDDPRIRFKKLKDIKFVESASAEELRASREKIVETLISNADKRKSEHARKEAVEYFCSLLEQYQTLISGGINPLFSMAKEMGLEVHELDAQQTVQELFENYEYHLKLNSFAKLLDRPIEDIKSIDKKLVNSWQIENLFQRYYEEKLLSDLNRSPESSSIFDKHLSSFSPYLMVIVDKRSREILDIIKKNHFPNLKYISISKIEQLFQL